MNCNSRLSRRSIPTAPGPSRLRGISRAKLLAAAAALLCGDACAAPFPGAFDATVANHDQPADPPPRGMTWIPGGDFSMGDKNAGAPLCGAAGGSADASPIHRVHVDGFWMDCTAVTNDEFAAFVEATGYVTVAERPPSPEEAPGVPPEELVAGSLVFTPAAQSVAVDDVSRWWSFVPGANWRHPEGPASDLKGRGNYPVVQVAYPDAEAYAHWASRRLPTEAEWEFAARGGASGKAYVWGDEFKLGGKFMANTWQGRFPFHDTGEDGFVGIAPVAQFPPNAYGLYDMAGNIWQWCADWYRPDAYLALVATGEAVPRNPAGPASSFDPAEPAAKKHVQRGGSFLCNDQYCSGYRVGARGKGETNTASNHVGFRCVQSVRPREVNR